MKRALFSYKLSNNLHFKRICFIPKFKSATKEECNILKEFFHRHNKLLVITGAGVSTESGIPDYRSEEVGLYARSNHKPVQYNEFLKSSEIRQRYWARNYIGWPKFSGCQPNIVHESLRALEESGKVSCIITQNVDNLHKKAGSKNIIELHGSSYRIICLSCSDVIPRYEFQNTLQSINPNIRGESLMIRPDGDVEISEDLIRKFNVPSCYNCKGILKPDIVFFGDNVPIDRVNRVKDEVFKSDALLVLGSSLSTFSAYRIILQAKEEGKEIAIVNIGPTRADKEVNIKISTKCGEILSKLFSNP